MNYEKLQTRLIELSKDPGLREALAMEGPGLVVLASHADGTPALTMDWTWLIDQLPTMLPVIFSLFATGNPVMLVPFIVKVIMKVFNISQSQAQVMLTQALAATQEPG